MLVETQNALSTESTLPKYQGPDFYLRLMDTVNEDHKLKSIVFGIYTSADCVHK